MQYDDDELLAMCANERRRSVGFGEGESSELADDRSRALRFYRGDMSKDVQSLANRSAAVSTDVAEAIDTALPDLVEVFIGGDDIATFQATSAEDEKQAQLESDYVKHVIFSENDGFLILNTVFKDALLTKTGLFHWWWEDGEEDETSQPVPVEAAALAVQQDPMLEVSEPDVQGMVTLTRSIKVSKVCIRAVPPEDFTVSIDTVSLRDTPYCAMRDRVRVQELIARGVDRDMAESLRSYTQPDQAVSNERDQAGEQTLNRANDGTGELRMVEVRSHYLRLLDEDGEELEVWRIDTDSEETVLISKEKVCAVPFGAITPYPNPHRFYGESISDKLVEIQKIKTTILRMFLDEGYFALNQRMTVNMNLASEFTIPDLLLNVPNMPVRTNGDGAIAPLRAGGLSFDALAALEHVSVMGEQRTGIMRNAQGLNPDTLHKTASGAIALLTAAQKRVRYIARIFAETGVRDLFQGVHELLRQGYGQEAEDGKPIKRPHIKIGREWQDIDPATWPERKGVDVQVGVGSAGREHDMMALDQIMNAQREMIMAGLPTASPENVYNAALRYAQVANMKAPERFFTDPKTLPPQPPKPDPEMAKAQGQLQLEQAKAQGQMQLAHAQAGANLDLERAKSQAQSEAAMAQAQNDHQLAMAKLQAETDLKRYQVDQELQLKREQLTAELQLKRELGFAQAEVAHSVGMAKVNVSTSTVEPGGDPG